MTPPLPFDDGDTPREAADRLYSFCDELERRQVPADQVEELRALSERFLSHMAGQFAFWERLEHYARRLGCGWKSGCATLSKDRKWPDHLPWSWSKPFVSYGTTRISWISSAKN